MSIHIINSLLDKKFIEHLHRIVDRIFFFSVKTLEVFVGWLVHGSISGMINNDL